MNRNQRHLLLAASSILLLFVGQLNAVSKRGTTAASFLEIGIGARGTSMGGAHAAVVDDVNSLYWNPGGLALMTRREASFIHTQWLAGIEFNNIAAAFPMGGMGALGVSITNMGIPDMAVTTIEEPEGTGEMFSSSNLCGTIGWARKFTDRFSFGANVKYIEERIWHMKASSVAVDLGTTFRTQFRDMKIGMSVSNFGGKMQLDGDDTILEVDIAPGQEGNNSRIKAHLDTDAFDLPLTFRVGLAGDVLKMRHARLTLAADAVHPNNYSESVSLGAEFSISDLVYLRGGHIFYLDDSDDQGNPYSPQGISLGGGVEFLVTRSLKFKMDVAYGDWGILSNVKRFSLGLEF